ncbi:MAG: hypothetical protein NWR73_01260 [Flavobacteriales bacterium]|nr:hypothetical protein [Flavobacteriales bacterium]MDP4826285.1 hypothetical protein [Flavobacteriales bacterium]
MHKITLLLTAFVVVFTFGCRKKDKDLSLFSARDSAFAELIFSDVQKVVEDVAKDTDGIRDRVLCIDEIVIDTLSTPRSILIDFGTDVCEDGNGVVRQGKIFTTYTGRLRETGTIITTTFIDYSIDGYGVQGTHTVSNLGLNSSDHPYFLVNVDNASITSPDNSFTISWDSTRQREWITGYDTQWLVDDEFLITGQANGINRFGDPFEMVITQPLKITFVCPWIVSGTIEATPDDNFVRVLDYGNGTCDNNATITVDGNVYNIKL